MQEEYEYALFALAQKARAAVLNIGEELVESLKASLEADGYETEIFPPHLHWRWTKFVCESGGEIADVFWARM